MDPFATLGLPRQYDMDRDELESRYRDLQKKLHPDRFASAPASERRLSLARAVEVNEAYRVLRDDLRRAQALLGLLLEGQDVLPDQPTDPEFLMQMMELREELGEAAAEDDLATVTRLAERVRAMAESASSALRSALAGEPVQVAVAKEMISQMKFYRRFLDQVEVIEEEALD